MIKVMKKKQFGKIIPEKVVLHCTSSKIRNENYNEFQSFIPDVQ